MNRDTHVCCGDVIEKKYRLTRDENDNAVYTEVGEVNIDDYVNSFAAGCSLRNLLERCSLLPVTEKIQYLNNQPSSLSGDFTDFNKDLTEMYIQFRKLASSDPELIKRIKSGESFNSIINDIINPKEVKTNGSSESGNE